MDFLIFSSNYFSKIRDRMGLWDINKYLNQIPVFDE